MLSATPGMLNAWLGNLGIEVLHKADKKDAWSTLDILKHLIYGEQTDWIVRLRLMETENASGVIPTFEPFDRLGHTANTENNPAILLDQFKQLRMANLATLETINQRTNIAHLEGIHPELGAVTGAHLLSTWASHDQTHIYQIARNLTSLFVHDVGPWFAYLKIINQNSYD